MHKPPASPQPKRSAVTISGAPVWPPIARSGYVACGYVYLIIGGFALLAAVDSGTHAVGNKGVLIALLSRPAGRLLLGLLAAGLICFAIWRLKADGRPIGRPQEVRA
jgi:hypothetical protein